MYLLNYVTVIQWGTYHCPSPISLTIINMIVLVKTLKNSRNKFPLHKRLDTHFELLFKNTTLGGSIRQNNNFKCLTQSKYCERQECQNGHEVLLPKRSNDRQIHSRLGHSYSSVQISVCWSPIQNSSIWKLTEILDCLKVYIAVMTYYLILTSCLK